MKKITLFKRKITLVLFFVLTYAITFSQNDNGLIDAPGDIAFVAFHDSDDGFSFLFLDDCPNGEIIRFIDEGWIGSEFRTPNYEGEVTWTNDTGSTISKGVVIDITDADDNGTGITASLGTAEETDSGFTTSNTKEQIYAITGTRAVPDTFLAFVGHATLDSSIPITLDGTGLVAGATAASIGSGEGYYTGTTSFSETLSDVAIAINTAGNWDQNPFLFPDIVPDSFTGTAFVPATPPTVSTTAASSIDGTIATLAGNVTTNGGATVTDRGIVYSVTSANADPLIGGTGVNQDTNGTGTGVFSEIISSLTLETAYSFKAYAINSKGTSYGATQTFTTLANETNTYATSGNWSETSNWSLGRVPIATDNIEINFGDTVLFDVASATVNDVTVNSSTLNIETGNAFTINGNLIQNGTFNILSGATSNGSLIVKGTSTGNISYLRHLTTSWHLIASPVEGQNINSFSGSVNITDTKYHIAPYKNNVLSNDRWDYFTTSAGTNNIATAGNFTKAKGYSIQKSSVAGTINLTGTLHTNDIGESISITDGGDNPNGSRWNLIGNPYSASLHGNNAANATNNFLKINIDTNNLDPDRAGMYVWNSTGPYEVKSVDDPTFYIAPGQAFFVHAPDGGGTSASFTEAMQTHQTGNIFLKSTTTYPEIILQLTNASHNSSTKIRYIENKTTGLDIGSDVGTFTGDGDGFKVFTHLLNNSNGVDFTIQALPNVGLENMVVPVGVHAEAGKEITFSLEASNFSSDIKLLLEDRITNTFTPLKEANSSYNVTVSESLNGIGRFYIHTTTSSLSVDPNFILNSVSIYKLDNSILRITGLPAGNATVTIYNLLGKKIINTTFSGSKDISLPKLTTGIYIVKLKTAIGQLNKKIILE